MRIVQHAAGALLAVGLLMAAVLGQAAEPPHAVSFGRLFFSPQERADMDRKRFAPAPAPRVEAPVAEALAPPVPPPSREVIKLEGYVQRSSGHSTLWVNGVPENDHLKLTPDGVQVDAGERRAIGMRVGDSYEIHSGTRQGVLSSGNVSVKP